MPLAPWWVPIVCAAPGIVSIRRGVVALAAMRAQRRWQQCEAVITASELDEGDVTELSVEYRYDVAGESYTNDHLLPGQDCVKGADALDLAHQYPRGRHTVVFYDPQDPAQSALELSALDEVVRPILFGGTTVVVAGFWFWLLAV
jgi:hypothetical protein